MLNSGTLRSNVEVKHCLSINNKNTRFFLSLSRRNIARLTGMLTGHCRGHCTLNKHPYTMGILNNPHCEKYGDEESALHSMCQYPIYIIGGCILPFNITWSLPPNWILNYLNMANRISINIVGTHNRPIRGLGAGLVPPTSTSYSIYLININCSRNTRRELIVVLTKHCTYAQTRCNKINNLPQMR